MYDTASALRCRQTQIQIIKCRLREIRYTHFTSRVLFGSSTLRIHSSSSLKQNVYTTSTQSTEHLLAPNCALQFIGTPSLLSKPLVTDKAADCLCFIQRNIALLARSYRHFSSRKSPPSYRSQQAAIIFLALVVTSRRPTVKTHPRWVSCANPSAPIVTDSDRVFENNPELLFLAAASDRPRVCFYSERLLNTNYCAAMTMRAMLCGSVFRNV